VFGREDVLDVPQRNANDADGESGIGAAGVAWIEIPREQPDPDQEVLLMLEVANRVEPFLGGSRMGEDGAHAGRHLVLIEAGARGGADRGIEQMRAQRHRRGEPRRASQNVAEQRPQADVVGQDREELTRRDAADGAVEGRDCGIGVRGA